MKSQFIGIGVGPGDKELLTLKAINFIKKCDIVFKPVVKKGKKSVAFQIIKEYIPKNTKIVDLVFKMAKDKNKRKKYRKELSEKIKKEVLKGNTCCFITIGDPCLYSTYMYIVKNLKKENIKIKTIPGITSFQSIFAKINESMALEEQNFAVYPVNNNRKKMKRIIELNDNIVFMKIKRNQKLIYEILKEKGLENNTFIASNIGKENEYISYEINDLVNKEFSYFTTLIVKKGGFDE
ncbi:MAG: precorrin-2 C(20)-methyltransferase [Bacillota bacterium]